MDLPATNVIQVISFLLPGFVAAWIFYGLTAHPKQAPFERTIQALIFTAIVQSMTSAIRYVLEFAGQWRNAGDWTQGSALVWSLCNAAVVGLAVAALANCDGFHRIVRWLGITSRTSYPSEWFSAFHRSKQWLTLHLEGDRRLYGWPVEWPDQCDSGHFVIAEPVWLLDNNQRAPLLLVDSILIPAKEVEMVELMRPLELVTASQDEIQSTENLLVQLRRKKVQDGKQGTTAGSPTEYGATAARAQRVHGPTEHNGSIAANVAPTATEKVTQKGRPRKNRHRS